MTALKVIKIDQIGITFEDGTRLESDHDQDCCECHELTFTDITLSDFEGLEFDLSNENFFRRIKDYGIELVPVHGHSVKIPGHGFNNGYYTSNIDLVIINGDNRTVYDISECQIIT